MNKLTTNIKPLDTIYKVNEIIDESTKVLTVTSDTDGNVVVAMNGLVVTDDNSGNVIIN